MSASYIAEIGIQAGTTSVTLIWPGGQQVGDLVVALIANKLDSATVTGPSDWQLIGTSVVGTGVAGLDTGPLRVSAFYTILTSASPANPVFTIAGGNVALGYGQIYRKLSTENWVACTATFGTDAVHDTTWSTTGSSDLGLAAGDFLAVISAGTANAGPTGRTITVAGTTGTVTGINSAGSATGNHLFIWGDRYQVTTGPSAGGPVSAGSHAVNQSGGAAFVRIATVAPTASTTTFPERLPFPFTLRESGLADSPLSRNGREIHYTIAGVPFRVQVTADMPLTIQSAPVQKDQQDVEPEAGENSLSGWWIRNQASWHEGAGARFAESRGEVKDTFQFWQSSNINVWTPGQLTMLRRAATVTDGAVRCVAAIPDPSVNAVVVGRVGNVSKYNNLDAGTATTTLWTEAGGNFNHVLAGDTQWWAALDTDLGANVRVFNGLLTGVGTPAAWQLTGGDSTRPMRILFAKHRLWACNGNKIWQINVAGGTPGAPVSVAAIWTHPSTSFVFTDLCDAPGGILVSGYGDGSSSLQQITLDAAGAVPTITGARVTAVLPNDEKILRISSLASSQVLLLTNRGVRLAVAQTNGEMIYGPRFMDRTEVPSTAKPQVVSAGRWWWLVWGDEPKVWRIDSSVEIDDGVLAYAQDMQSGATNFSGITVRNERPIVCDASGNLAYRHATELEAAGSLTGGRIRYRTDEPKTFQRIATTIAPLAGTLEVVVLNEADTERSLITYNDQGKTNIAVAELPNEANPNRFASVKLNFTRKATDATQGPTVYGVQVKALPASKPQRVYQIPLMCYDREEYSTGGQEGYDGYARDRYEALKMAENAGSPVMLVDFTVEPTIGQLCRIEELRMIRHTQPHATNQVGSWGGILVATLRTLT